MQTDAEFYRHFDDLVASRQVLLERFRRARFPVKAWLSVRRPNPLGLRWVYFYVGGSSVRQITPQLLKRRGVVPSPDLLSAIARLRHVDLALEAMLRDAEHAIKLAQRFRATLGDLAKRFQFRSIADILARCSEDGLPVLIPSPYESWPTARRRLLPFLARQSVIDVLEKCFQAISRDVTIHRVEKIKDLHTSKRGTQYYRQIRLILNIRKEGRVMPKSAHWALWVRGKNKKWKMTDRLLSRPRNPAETGRKIVVPKRLSRTWLGKIHMQKYAAYFVRMSGLLEQIMRARNDARKLFYMVNHIWSSTPRKHTRLPTTYQTTFQSTERAVSSETPSLPQVLDSPELKIEQLKTDLRNRLSRVRQITVNPPQPRSTRKSKPKTEEKNGNPI